VLVATALSCAVVASIRAGRGPTDGLLSELGATSMPGHWWYRAAQAAAATAVAARAGVVGRRAVALPLAVAAVGLTAATLVPCTTGCPLPVVDGVPPAQDAIHFLGAAVAFALAPAATWAAAESGPISRVSTAVTAVLVVLLSLLGPAALIDAHGAVAAIAQRLLAVTALGWVAAARPAIRDGPARRGIRTQD
jgi:hypothetical protein